MKKILSSLMTIGILGGVVYGSTTAFFSDIETSENNTLIAGSLDLTVNGADNLKALVSIEDLKPGDDYDIEKKLFIDSNPAKVYLHIKDLKNSQGVQSEPEIEEEIQNGEQSNLEDYLIYDLSIGGETIISYEDEILLSDVSSCWIPIGTLPGAEEVIAYQGFHLPDTVTNWAQGDTLTFTEEFYAIQERNNNESPQDTGSGRLWDNELKKCVQTIGAALNRYTQPTGEDCDINVPSEYGTIQTAIDVAEANDTICIDAGTYDEDVIINKSITLSGNGATNTSIINGQSSGAEGAIWIQANNVIVEGFVINGAGIDYPNAALHIGESISNVIVRYNHLVAGNGGLALLTDGWQNNHLIQNNVLEGNNSPHVAIVNGTPGAAKESTTVNFLNNTFTGTVSPTDRRDTGVVLTQHATDSLIQKNIFETTGSIIKLIDNAYPSVLINENNFNSFVDIKIHTGAGGPLNAENNWWGDNDPSDNISGEVDFIPFATSPFLES